MTPHDSEIRREMLDRLLEAALPHIAFDGWTRAAFEAGAEDAGLDPIEIGIAFRKLPDDALDHFADWADRAMLADIRADESFAQARVRDKIALGVRKRLDRLGPHRDATRRSVGLLSRPSRGPLAARLVWRTSDRLWNEAGDTATDFNHYSKRALLSAVFGSTTLYWLNDTSAGHEATWDFLSRRIETVLKIGGRAGRFVSRWASTGSSAGSSTGSYTGASIRRRLCCGRLCGRSPAKS